MIRARHLRCCRAWGAGSCDRVRLEGPPGVRDETAAGAILCRLRDRGAELDERAERVVYLYLTCPGKFLRQNRAAQRLKRLGYEKDLGFCLAENTVPVVPLLAGEAFVGRR